MLIFDRFPSTESADKFALATKERFKLDASSYPERRDDIDPFPFALDGPVVYVERPENGSAEEEIAIEKAITDSVSEFDGSFAGT